MALSGSDQAQMSHSTADLYSAQLGSMFQAMSLRE